MAEPRDPREPRIPKESPPFDADNKWTRTWIMYFESLFTLSVKEAVRQTLEVAVTHTTGDLTKDLPVFGNDKADIKVGTKSGNTTEVATVSGAVVTGNTVKWDANGNLIDAGTAPGGGGSGTVTHTGGALTADQPVFGAGSADIKVGTKTGNTDKVVTNTGTNITGNTVKWDASGNLIDAGSAPGSGTVTSVTGTAPIASSGGSTPAISIALASSSAFGAVKVDGTTITAASGVISAGSGSAGALILLEQHTASSSSSLDFTAWYSSGYDEYAIEFINLVPSTSGQNLYLRCSTNGGSSYDSGSNYKWQAQVMYTGATTNTFPAGSNSDTGIFIGTNPSNSSSIGTSGSWKLFDPGNASKYKTVEGQFSGEDNNHVGNFETGYGGGVYVSTTAVNAFRILFQSGNITSGIARVYGISKSTVVSPDFILVNGA